MPLNLAVVQGHGRRDSKGKKDDVGEVSDVSGWLEIQTLMT